MRRIILASHGKFAEGLCDSVKMIMDDERLAISSYGLHSGHSLDELLQKIKDEIACHPQDTFFILTDLFGGSVCNSLASLVEMKRVNILSGMNLCMLLTICLCDETWEDERVIEKAVKEARSNIIDLKALWKRKEEILYDQDVAY